MTMMKKLKTTPKITVSYPKIIWFWIKKSTSMKMINIESHNKKQLISLKKNCLLKNYPTASQLQHLIKKNYAFNPSTLTQRIREAERATNKSKSVENLLYAF